MKQQHAAEQDSGAVADVLGSQRQTKKVLSSLRLKVAFMASGPELANHELFAGVMSKPVRSSELESNIARALGEPSLSTPLSAQELLAAATPHGPRRVLVAEDNPINQEVIVEILSGLGYAADIVGNGRLAVVAWESGGYRVILMDCQMPELDGYAAAREIRERETGGQRVALRDAAHKLKGSCLSVGVPRMAALCASLESSSANPRELISELMREFDRVREHLEPLVPRSSA